MLGSGNGVSRHLADYQALAEQLTASADKTAIAETARLLAVYVGYYQRRYGPIEPKRLATLQTESATEEQAADLAEAMRCLAAALTITRIQSDPDVQTAKNLDSSVRTRQRRALRPKKAR
jgi:hypothetical protein